MTDDALDGDAGPEPIDLGALRRERTPVTDHVVKLGEKTWTIPHTSRWPARCYTLMLQGRVEEALAITMGPAWEQFMAATDLTTGDLNELMDALIAAEGATRGKSPAPAASRRRTGRR